MNKSLITLLCLVPSIAFGADVYSNIGATALKIVAANDGTGTFAEFVDNPVPGECGSEYLFDPDNSAMTAVLESSRTGPRVVILTIRDPLPGFRKRCILDKVNSLE